MYDITHEYNWHEDSQRRDEPKHSVGDTVYISDTTFTVKTSRQRNDGIWEYELVEWIPGQWFGDSIVLSVDEHAALVARVEALIEANYG